MSEVGGWVAVLMVDVGVLVEDSVLGVGTGEVSDDSRDDDLAVRTVGSSDVVAVTAVEIFSAWVSFVSGVGV